MGQTHTPRATPVAQSEPVAGVIPGLRRRKGFLGMQADAYSLVVTPSRLVFALLTSKMQKDAVEQARQEAKQEGKGALGQWGAQFGWTNVIVRRYQSMPVEAILAEESANTFIPNDQIKKVRVKVDVGDENTSSSTTLEIETASGKHKYEVTSGSSTEVKRLLQQTLGNLVK